MMPPAAIGVAATLLGQLARPSAAEWGAPWGLPLDPLPAAHPFDITLYTGRWYGMFADPISTATFQRGLVCVTADYGLLPNGSLSVLNAGRVGAPDGPLRTISGIATCPPPGAPPDCAVQLWGGAPGPAPYLIAAVGPVVPGPPGEGGAPGSGQYAWAAVSNAWRTSLFILARDPAVFYDAYAGDALGWARANGFVWPWNRPVPILQEGCDPE